MLTILCYLQSYFKIFEILCRAGASTVPGDINKNEGTSSPASSSPHVTPKSDLERTTPPRDLTAGANKERLLMKGSNKYVFMCLEYDVLFGARSLWC